jgi:hypothetical protein
VLAAPRARDSILEARQASKAARQARVVPKQPPKRAPDPAIGVLQDGVDFGDTVRALAAGYTSDNIIPLETARDRARAVADRRDASYERHGAPLVRALGSSVIPFVVLVVFLAGAGVFLLVVIRELEIGVLKDIGVADVKANVLGSIGAIALSVSGLLLFECVAPTFAMAHIRDMDAGRRRAIGAGAAGAWVLLIIIAAVMSSARAEARHGEALVRAKANCAAVLGDPEQAATAIVACGEAESLQRTFDRTRLWDQTATVASAMGEAVGAWGLLRVVELGAAAAMAGAAARQRRIIDAHDDKIALANAAFTGQMLELGGRVRAKVPPGDALAAIQAVLGGPGPDDGGPADEGGSDDDPHAERAGDSAGRGGGGGPGGGGTHSPGDRPGPGTEDERRPGQEPGTNGTEDSPAGEPPPSMFDPF